MVGLQQVGHTLTMVDLCCGLPPMGDVNQARPGGKRKRTEASEEKDEGGVTQEFRPLKRVSPFLNTPKQRKDEKRKVLRMSYEKLRGIDDPERCLLRSVLIHNTARKMQMELVEEGGYWARSSRGMLGYPPQVDPMGVPEELYQDRFLSRHRHLSCEYEVVNNSYLYANAHLFVDNHSHANSEMEEICRDDLSRVIEQSINSQTITATPIMDSNATKSTGKPLCPEPRHSGQKLVDNSDVGSYKDTPKVGCSAASSKNPANLSPANSHAVHRRPTCSPAAWDYHAYAANLTGAPLFTGSITMGIPMNKDRLHLDHAASTASKSLQVAAMETDISKEDSGILAATGCPDAGSTDTAFESSAVSDQSGATKVGPCLVDSPPQCDTPVLACQQTDKLTDCCNNVLRDSCDAGASDSTPSALPAPSAHLPSQHSHDPAAHGVTRRAATANSYCSQSCTSCDCDKSTTEHGTCSRRIVTSATTLATFSHELDNLMTDYLSRSHAEASRPLSCVYLSGVHSDRDRDTCTSKSADTMESVLNSLVPVLGGM